VNAHEAPGHDREPQWAPLVDMSDIALDSVRADDDSPLARSIRRVLRSLDDPNGVISGFESFAST
jgi:FXSXX-COOH protein